MLGRTLTRMRLRIALALASAAVLPALALAAPASAAVSTPAAQTAPAHPANLSGGWQFQDESGYGYWLDYPGKGGQIETQGSAHAAVYYPTDPDSWDGLTLYQWEAGTTGQCITWDSSTYNFYEANCGEYPASQAIAIDGLYLVDQYASQSGGGTYGLGAVTDSDGSHVGTYNDTHGYGLNDWYSFNCCTAPK